MKAAAWFVLPLAILSLSAQDRARGGRAVREGSGPRPRFDDAVPEPLRGNPARSVPEPRSMAPAPGPARRTLAPASLPEPTPRHPGTLGTYPGTRVILPPAWDRCTVLPTAAYWGTRDLFNDLRWMARTGLIPVTEVGATVDEVVDVAEFPAGWRCYGVAIPAGGKLTVELSHPNLGWFRLMAVRRDGTPGPGMLNALAAYRPTSFTLANPTDKAGAVYLIVDDPGWMSSKEEPFHLTFKRDWDPAKADLSEVKMVQGIWGASPSNSAQFRGPSLTGPAVYPH